MAQKTTTTILTNSSGVIPDRELFRIGEVARILAVRPSVLRFWETEFPRVAPRKSGSGHRVYRRADVELLLRIRELLYVKKYSIEGARKRLREKDPEEAPDSEGLMQAVRELDKIVGRPISSLFKF